MVRRLLKYSALASLTRGEPSDRKSPHLHHRHSSHPLDPLACDGETWRESCPGSACPAGVEPPELPR